MTLEWAADTWEPIGSSCGGSSRVVVGLLFDGFSVSSCGLRAPFGQQVPGSHEAELADDALLLLHKHGPALTQYLEPQSR